DQQCLRCKKMVLRCLMTAHCQNHIKVLEAALDTDDVRFIPILSCPFCKNVDFVSLGDVHYHMELTHKALLKYESPLIFVCKLKKCKASFSNLRSLCDHWKKHKARPGMTFDQAAADSALKHARLLLKQEDEKKERERKK
ncbi:hypothetical protein PFISCL1PPCAC_24510, partial [Pristionchus fissidentatus]